MVEYIYIRPTDIAGKWFSVSALNDLNQRFVEYISLSIPGKSFSTKAFNSELKLVFTEALSIAEQAAVSSAIDSFVVSV